MVAVPGSSINPGDNGTTDSAPASIPEEAPQTPQADTIQQEEPSGNQQMKKGGIQRGVETIRDWNWLQKDIRRLKASVTQADWSIQEKVNLYRLALSAVSFKSNKVDSEIWQLYRQIQDKTPPLKLKTQKTLLFLTKRSHLAELHQSLGGALQLATNAFGEPGKSPQIG